MAGNGNPIAFLTEDITTEILLRLPTAVCIARFRCVCRSWRILLTDPQFIRKILFFQNFGDLKSLRILFAGAEEDEAFPPSTIDYSLHSYDDLRPISSGDLPSVPYKLRPRYPHYHPFFHLDIVGCCNGIFCISKSPVYGGSISEIILWNPTTSETKRLPVSLCPNRPNDLEVEQELIGFGFDPETNDYKVVRRATFGSYFGFSDDDDDDDDDDYGFPTEKPPVNDSDSPFPFIYTEVYSLRNDSWKRVLPEARDLTMNYPRYIHQRDASRNEKCYWFLDRANGCRIVSFDVREETFEEGSEFDLPRVCVSENSQYDTVSCYMLKESFVATLQYPCCHDGPMDVWALMKYGVVGSWTKLFTVRPPLAIHHYLEIWKGGAYICSPQMYRRCEGNSAVELLEHEGVYIFYPAAEKISTRLDIKVRNHWFQSHTYTPTLVSLLDF